jgi:hypothetical protein
VAVLACSVAAGDGVVWAAGCPLVVRLSSGDEEMRILRNQFVPFQQPRSAETNRIAMRDMAVGEDALWVLGDPVDKRVFRVDHHSGRILGTTTLPVAPRSIAAGAGAVWVSALIDDVVVRLDPATGRRLQVIEVGRGASGIAVGAGAVWVASALDREVWRLDPVSGEALARIPVDGAPREVAVGAGGVWVTADAG